ncbi:Ivy family c-type lysozyme inhibitor [Pectobacterium aroidearum]|uniref:Ivy family c-type lysozyme inhibitor n=1 Tax=Pectobacterium aroidearum TaxID=1201031 RepID=UPI00315826F7
MNIYIRNTIWATVSLPLLNTVVCATTGAKTASEALQCKIISVGNQIQNTCPYPSELYSSDPQYKKDIDASMDAVGLKNLMEDNTPLDGPESPLSPIEIAGKVWLKGSMCEAHNCGGHYLNFLYQPIDHRVLGYYFGERKGFIGEPGEEEKKILFADEIEKNETAKRIAEANKSVANNNPDAPPPNTIWEFTNKNGQTLWQACGSSNSTCVLIASAKFHVAVFNRVSKSACAFGDLYIVNRGDIQSWQQYDTGTCSPNAYITQSKTYGLPNVDIGINGVLVKRYPIGAWSFNKEKHDPVWLRNRKYGENNSFSNPDK